MDLKKTEARNDRAGEGQQQSNQPTNQQLVTNTWQHVQYPLVLPANQGNYILTTLFNSLSEQ
jgi:hypothetical protein